MRRIFVIRWTDVALTLSLCLAGGHQTVEVEFVGVSFAVHFGHDVFVVVVSEDKKKKDCRGQKVDKTEVLPQRPGQFVVIHVRLRFPLAPASGDLIRIGELEFAIGAFPRDAGGVRRIV